MRGTAYSYAAACKTLRKIYILTLTVTFSQVRATLAPELCSVDV